MTKTYSIIPDCCLGSNISDPLMKMLWIELYAMANFGDTDNLHRGQLSTTYSEISKRTAMTLKQVRNRIAMLVANHELLKQKTNQGIILTIVSYDKNLNGKGRYKKAATINVSKGCDSSNQQKGNPKADTKADRYACITDESDRINHSEGAAKGRQNRKNDALYISKRNKRDVVAEGNNSNSFSSSSVVTNERNTILDKQLKFKNDVLSFIEFIGWNNHLDTPAFKEAVENYLGYYGAWKEGKFLCYETIKGFTIDGSLRKWIRNEKSLTQDKI